MPIPSETDHGWVNSTDQVHHVPFIFGSLNHGGWGVFLDVEPQPAPIEQITRLVDRNSSTFSQMVYLEREIKWAEPMQNSWRKILIPFTVTNRRGSGGLELALTRVNPAGFTFPKSEFRIISVARGEGIVSIDGVERAIRRRDHFGVPSDLTATLKQTGGDPLVLLDTLIRTFPN